MPILNYTITIEASKTVMEIQNILVKHGAKSIMTNFDSNGVVESLSFLANTPQGEVAIKLPVNVEAVWKILIKMKQDHRGSYGYISEERKRALRSQAVRVAWRIVKDWVEAQMAILETKMVNLDQIFLPYIETQSGKTVYQLFQEKQRLLTQGNGG